MDHPDRVAQAHQGPGITTSLGGHSLVGRLVVGRLVADQEDRQGAQVVLEVPAALGVPEALEAHLGVDGVSVPVDRPKDSRWAIHQD